MEEQRLAERYAPIIYFDVEETIPLAAVGYTVFREERRSDSFPKRTVAPDAGGLVIEYALYWDFDIQHMYDLEHIWVWVSGEGEVTRAQASFHGKYLTLWEPEMPYGLAPEDGHVHAFCQPGKHAFLPDGDLFRLIPDWYACCNAQAGGPVLVGGPFQGMVHPTPEEDTRCEAYIRGHLAFEPTLIYDDGAVVPEQLLCPWDALKAEIPGRIARLCGK